MILLRDWLNHWTIILGGMSFLLSWFWLRPRFGRAAASLFAYCAFSAIYVWIFRDNRYLPVDPYNQTALRYFAADSLAKAVLVVMPLALLSECRIWMRLIGEASTRLFVVLNSIVTIATFCFSGFDLSHDYGGIVGNASISAGLMVAMLPIIVSSKRDWWAVLLVLISVFLSRSSIAFGMLGLYSVFTLLPRGRLGFQSAMIAVFSLLAIAKVSAGSQLLNDSDRFRIWRYMIVDRWAHPDNVPFGMGLGTYHVFSINLQNTEKAAKAGISTNYTWNTFHNEFLQMLFECGVVGFFLLCLTYLIALFKTLLALEFDLALSVILFGAYMSLNPALHQPIPALFGAWLFILALRRNNNEVPL